MEVDEAEIGFDPFQLEAPKPFEARFKDSLVARAKKRVVRGSGVGWLVSGLKGEMQDRYYVEYRDGDRKYWCECYSTNHGETRQRRMCSHVLAVILWRKNSSLNGANDRKGDELADQQITVGEGDGDNPHSHLPESQAELQYPVTDSHSGIPDRDDPIWGILPLPQWVGEIRPHQWNATQEVLEHYERGVMNVWVDAPTGSGKTLIGEMVRRLMGTKALYTCSGLVLQDQFKRDFDYAKVLKGKGNYPTQLMPEPYNCGDCTLSNGGCDYCEDKVKCPYQVAKAQAKMAPIAIINTSYLLAEANYVGEVVKSPELVVLDECDVLEGELMGFVEFKVGDRVLRELKLTAPKKGSHKTTIQEWLTGDFKDGVRKALGAHANQTRLFNVNEKLEEQRRRMRLERLARQAAMVSQQITGDEWIRDNDAGPLVMKPVKVSEYGEQYLWRHSKRWLSMSATIVSPDELCDSLGLDAGKCGLVRVPMTFPVENRRIIVAPVANMVAKEKDTAWPAMARAIERVMERHPEERILVHTVSYALSSYLSDQLRSLRTLTYTSANGRDACLERYRREPGSVLLAASMDRGIDLRDEDCRVVIVAKVPFPFLGDKQVSARMHLPNGNAWYSVAAIRSLVQMTGRGVRSAEDHCTTYILDRQFVSNLYKRNKNLFPAWWREALVMNFNTRELTR